MSNVLEAKDLCKVYTDAGDRVVVLDRVNFAVEKQQMIAIVGSSGAGKTTLLQLLGGLDQPTAGSVYVAGKMLTRLNEKQKGRLRNQSLGFVYQFHHLMPEFNAMENVCIPLLLRGEKIKAVREKAGYYIEQVGLENRLDHRIGELSGGERQRIAIARALVIEPACILADEPTGNLDEVTAGHITDLLLSLNQLLATSFVIVTHNRQMARKMQRTFHLESGKLYERSDSY